MMITTGVALPYSTRFEEAIHPHSMLQALRTGEEVRESTEQNKKILKIFADIQRQCEIDHLNHYRPENLRMLSQDISRLKELAYSEEGQRFTTQLSESAQGILLANKKLIDTVQHHIEQTLTAIECAHAERLFGKLAPKHGTLPSTINVNDLVLILLYIEPQRLGRWLPEIQRQIDREFFPPVHELRKSLKQSQAPEALQNWLEAFNALGITAEHLARLPSELCPSSLRLLQTLYNEFASIDRANQALLKPAEERTLNDMLLVLGNFDRKQIGSAFKDIHEQLDRKLEESVQSCWNLLQTMPPLGAIQQWVANFPITKQDLSRIPEDFFSDKLRFVKAVSDYADDRIKAEDKLHAILSKKPENRTMGDLIYLLTFPEQETTAHLNKPDLGYKLRTQLHKRIESLSQLTNHILDPSYQAQKAALLKECVHLISTISREELQTLPEDPFASDLQLLEFYIQRVQRLQMEEIAKQQAPPIRKVGIFEKPIHECSPHELIFALSRIGAGRAEVDITQYIKALKDKLQLLIDSLMTLSRRIVNAEGNHPLNPEEAVPLCHQYKLAAARVPMKELTSLSGQTFIPQLNALTEINRAVAIAEKNYEAQREAKAIVTAILQDIALHKDSAYLKSREITAIISHPEWIDMDTLGWSGMRVLLERGEDLLRQNAIPPSTYDALLALFLSTVEKKLSQLSSSYAAARKNPQGPERSQAIDQYARGIQELQQHVYEEIAPPYRRDVGPLFLTYIKHIDVLRSRHLINKK